MSRRTLSPAKSAVVRNLETGRSPVTGSALRRKPVFRDGEDDFAEYVGEPEDLDDGDRNKNGDPLPLHEVIG